MTKTPPPPLTRIELDIIIAGSKCNEPGCKCGGTDTATEIGIVCKKHPQAGVFVRYSKGILTLICVECKYGVNRVAVA